MQKNVEPSRTNSLLGHILRYAECLNFLNIAGNQVQVFTYRQGALKDRQALQADWRKICLDVKQVLRPKPNA